MIYRLDGVFYKINAVMLELEAMNPNFDHFSILKDGVSASAKTFIKKQKIT